jgi:hypothetical protein
VITEQCWAFPNDCSFDGHSLSVNYITNAIPTTVPSLLKWFKEQMKHVYITNYVRFATVVVFDNEHNRLELAAFGRI